MKCDKLERYTLDIDFDENVISIQNDDGGYMDAYEVDEAIDELKAKIAQLEDDVAFWKNKYNDCKRELDLLKDTNAFYNGGKE